MLIADRFLFLCLIKKSVLLLMFVFTLLVTPVCSNDSHTVSGSFLRSTRDLNNGNANEESIDYNYHVWS